MQVMVDDHFVCKNAEPVFSKANGNELWVLIAEKAWAKIHGSFERIEGGMSHLTMRDLTGAPAYHYNFAKSAKEGMNLANEILKWDEQNFIITAGIGEETGSQNIKDIGLVAQHSYGVIGAS